MRSGESLGPWLALARRLGPDYERGALALDPRGEPFKDTVDFLSGWDRPEGGEVHPWGLDLESGGLWEPWRAAREAVERLAEGPQEPGARADYIVVDRGAGRVTLGSVGAWRPGCPRLAARACPRMAPMGHDSPHADCNYWSWSGMAKAAPGLEFFPEWQRFDCSRYYPLFQVHLCGEALAGILGLEPRWVFHAPAEALSALRTYAALTSRPDAFEPAPLP